MIDLVRHCVSAKVLDHYPDALRLNSNSHDNLFPRGGPNHVKYTLSLLEAWDHHQNPALEQTAMTDPPEWADDLSAESGACLQDLDLFSLKIAKVYSDKDRCRMAVNTVMQEYIQLPQ